MSQQKTFESSIPFDQRFDAVAVFCSDGRFGDQADEFLHKGLGLSQYDRVVLPGGPGSLAGHDRANVAAEGALADLRFLIEAHKLDRVVLIQHDGCAFYGQGLGLEAEAVEPQQAVDLRKAAGLIREQTGVGQIEGYFARRTDQERIVFEPVELG